jgi:acyl-CoA thioesterase-1
MNKLIYALALVVAGTARAEPVTIIALGDSLTQGYGLREDLGFVPRLQAWLNNAGAEAEIVNAGVSGDTTAGGLSRVGWALDADADAMIVTLGGNDLLRGIDPEVSRSNLDRILQVAQDRGIDVLLVGMEAPGNYGAEYKRSFDAMFPELSEAYGTLYLDNFFTGLPSRDPAALGDFMQPDGIHPNARGVERIVEGLGPYVLELIGRAED